MNEVRTTKPRRAPLGESHLRDHSRMWRCACFVCPVTTAPQRHFNTRVSLMALLGGALAALFLSFCACVYAEHAAFVLVSLPNAYCHAMPFGSRTADTRNRDWVLCVCAICPPSPHAEPPPPPLLRCLQ